MEYIVFGAGADGREAFNCLGQRVRYFCDNGLAGREVCGKEVLSFTDMLIRYNKGESIIVIASSKYQMEMELQLKFHGVERYFLFSRNAWEVMKWQYWTRYCIYCNEEFMSYSEVLMRNNIGSFKHIAVSNVNVALPYLLSEIAFQCNQWTVDYILSDEALPGMKFMGVPIVDRKILKNSNEVDCLIINARRKDTAIRDELDAGMMCQVMDIYDISKFVPAFQHPELVKFKDIHKGKRCFIIGNGPSLKMEDLDKLYENQEICFGVNKIYKSFPYTKWRPTYHCLSDDAVIQMYDENIDKKSCQVIYADTYHWSNFDRSNEVDYVHMVGEEYGNNLPGWSFDITQCVYNGCTVIYDICLQMAVYMGIKEIYLLGTDCSSPNGVASADSHFISDYCSKEEEAMLADFDFDANWRKIMQGYRKAELISRKHGFRIYNATRGGALEEFERVDFDSLFNLN